MTFQQQSSVRARRYATVKRIGVTKDLMASQQQHIPRPSNVPPIRYANCTPHWPYKGPHIMFICKRSHNTVILHSQCFHKTRGHEYRI